MVRWLGTLDKGGGVMAGVAGEESGVFAARVGFGALVLGLGGSATWIPLDT